MRKGSADVGFLLSGGFDLLGTSTVFNEEREAILEDATVLGDADEQHAYVGVKRFSLSQEGFYDDASDGSNDALIGLAQRVVCYGPEGNTLGKKMVGFEGPIQHMYRRVMSRGALHKANADYQGSGKAEDGIVQHIHTAETAASGEATRQDNSSSSANGGVGYLQVSALALGGYTDVTLKLRDSSDDIAYADLVVFANVSTAPTAERKTVAGTVEKFVKAEWAFNGAGSGQSIKFMTGFVRD